MDTADKKRDLPLVLKIAMARNDIAESINRAKNSGLPYTIISEILLNITNQTNSFAVQEQRVAEEYLKCNTEKKEE